MVDFQLEKGYPNESTGSKNKEWIEECSKVRDILMEWLEEFKIKYGGYNEASEIIKTSENLFERYKKEVDAHKVAYDVTNARNSRSILEYGLDHHLSSFNTMVWPFPSLYLLSLCHFYLLYFHFVCYSSTRDFQGTLDSQRGTMNGWNQ